MNSNGSRFFNVSALAIALISSSAMANDTEQFVLKTQNINTLNQTPGVVSFKSTANGQYTVMTVLKEQSNSAKGYWQTMGVVNYPNSLLLRANSLNNPSGQANSAADEELPRFNDPLLNGQTALNNEQTRYAIGMTSFREVIAKPRVAILDAGVDPHEDHRVKAGYSFTTLFDQSESDNYRPAQTNNGFDCKSNHGNAMMGITAATQNNRLGIAGIVDADIYIGKVMSTDCSTGVDVGSVVDLYNGLNWAMGTHRTQTIPQVDVINISLSADADCPVIIQEAIDQATEKGIAVVVSAGNFGSTDGLTSGRMPANCKGVIVVGSHNSDLTYASYSSRGEEIVASLHGTYTTTFVGSGSTPPSEYQIVTGTSASAAAASGFLGLVKSNFPNATPEELKKVLQMSTVSEQTGCATGDCGNGPLDARKMVDVAEHILDPVITFSHAFSSNTCEMTKKKIALVNSVAQCGAYHVKVDSRYASLGNEYEIKVLKKLTTDRHLGWDSNKAQVISEHTVTQNSEWIGLRDTSIVEYDYAAVACYENECPFPVELDTTSAGTPDNCL